MTSSTRRHPPASQLTIFFYGATDIEKLVDRSINVGNVTHKVIPLDPKLGQC
jgi:hypothetical protein